MTPPRDWSAIKALFFEAVELGPPERVAFLARACGADAGLRAEVESLLAAHDDDRPFLDAQPVAGAARVLHAAIDGAGHQLELQPAARIGQYEVLEPLGSGGMADVYLARDTRLDRFVALKIVLDSATGRTADRVLGEARAASALNHPNICTLYEAGEHEGQPYLAMEYIAGQPLSALIPAGGFPAPAVVKHGVQIADALAHAHEHGVIHRDLKAANVVVTPDGRAKVLDLGIARRLTTVAGTTSATLSENGEISGTLAYMAPELLRDRAADARSDIWALGVLLYELAAGRRPFVGDTPFEVSSAILNEVPPPLPPQVPATLRAAILRCLERNPDDRFQRASDVVAALEVSADPVRGGGFRSIGPIRRTLLGLGVAASLLTAGFVAYQWRDPAVVKMAVLPFKVLSGAQEIGFLGIGVPNQIISRVALLRTVRVRAALAPGKEDEEPQAAGRALGVDYVLTGTIHKEGERIRITPRLVRVADGIAIWTDSYRFSSKDLFRLQDEIARGVVDALPVQMTGEDRARVYRRYTQNAEAYALYLRGREALAPNRRASTLAAVAAFQAALALDRDYVLAHAGLAMASAKMRHLFATEEEVGIWDKQAHQAAQRAIELDRDLGEAHEAMAAVYRSAEFDWAGVISEAGEALARNPSLDQAQLYRASAFMHLGLLERAAAEASAAMDSNPANVAEPLRVQGVSALYGGGFAAAVPLLERASAESNAPVEWNLAYAHFNAGRRAEAEAMLRNVRGDSARTQRRAQATLASFLAARGERAEARKLIDDVISSSYMDHHVAYSLGAAYANLDNPSEALKRLKEAKDSGFPCFPWFEVDPLLAPLRADSRFRSFMDEFRQSWETRKALFAAKE